MTVPLGMKTFGGGEGQRESKSFWEGPLNFILFYIRMRGRAGLLNVLRKRQLDTQIFSKMHFCIYLGRKLIKNEEIETKSLLTKREENIIAYLVLTPF